MLLPLVLAAMAALAEGLEEREATLASILLRRRVVALVAGAKLMLVHTMAALAVDKVVELGGAGEVLVSQFQRGKAMLAVPVSTPMAQIIHPVAAVAVHLKLAVTVPAVPLEMVVLELRHQYQGRL
jgi:hypothetical protein